MEKPQITYPCTWSYRVIGANKDLMVTEIPGKLGSIRHEISIANHSAKGKYVSVNVDAIVNNESERLSIIPLLRSISEVKMVI